MLHRRQALRGLVSLFGASAWAPGQIDYRDPLYRPINVMDFAEVARQKLDPLAWDYLEGGSEDEITLRENREAFLKLILRPRALVDVHKIDLSLVRASATHGASEAVLRALGTLARNRGHRIVAEGIETPDHLESVLELRYDAGQGYLFGRAEPTLDRQPIDLFALLSTTGQEQPAA